MYETHYPTDWDRLTSPEVVERAYALGVTAACDRFDRAEFRRLLGELDAHDRGVARFVFREGRREARNRLSAGESPDEVWSGLVRDRNETVSVADDGPDERVDVADDGLDERVGVADGGRDRPATETGESARSTGLADALGRDGRLERGPGGSLPGFLRGP